MIGEGSPAGFIHASRFEFASDEDRAVYENAWRELDETMRGMDTTVPCMRVVGQLTPEALLAMSRTLRGNGSGSIDAATDVDVRLVHPEHVSWGRRLSR